MSEVSPSKTVVENWRSYCDSTPGFTAAATRNMFRDLSAEIERLHAEVTYAYEAGWRTAAEWANRDDLCADIGSSAYERAKANALDAAPESRDG